MMASLLHKSGLLIVWCFAGFFVTACASPSARIYTLVSQNAVRGNGSPVSLSIETVDVAKFLDRPQLIRWASDVQLIVSEFDRWGEPVGGMIQRVLAEDLRQRLPTGSVVTTSHTIVGNEKSTLQLAVSRLDVNVAGTVTLAAVWQIHYNNGRDSNVSRTNIDIQPTNSSMPAQIEAMSVAVAKLADDIVLDLLNAHPVNSSRGL